MSAEILGVSLEKLRGPIRTALKEYGEISGDLKFDVDNASNLSLTSTKPNSARSETEAFYRNAPIGSLFVIAFKPGDGTGSEINFNLKDLAVDTPYPIATLIVPRNKTGVHSEAHLTIVTHKIEDVHAEPKLFAGTYDLLGLKGNKIVKIGQLGHPINQDATPPVTTLTVGYNKSERFGDPHAVYSAIPTSIQVCAFLAISEAIETEYTNILKSLNPKLPQNT